MLHVVKKIKKFFFDPKARQDFLAAQGVYNKMLDEPYLKMRFNSKFGRELNLENPTTFNEKLQWLKLHDRKSIYTTMVDKYAVKQYVSDRIGAEYVIPTLGVWNSFDEIDFDSLPDQFVLKCTHDSGGLVIVKDKSRLDRKKAQSRIDESLKRNYFYLGREWPYKDVRPRILAEQFMQDGNSEVLNVYKIFNFNGEPRIIQVIQGDKTKSETIDYFDVEWNLLKFRQNYPNSEAPLKRPETLEEMLFLAKKLAADAPPFIRTDFYEANGRVYFSEFTFYSDSGMAAFHPFEWDLKLGSWIKLPMER